MRYLLAINTTVRNQNIINCKIRRGKKDIRVGLDVQVLEFWERKKENTPKPWSCSSVSVGRKDDTHVKQNYVLELCESALFGFASKRSPRVQAQARAERVFWCSLKILVFIFTKMYKLQSFCDCLHINLEPHKYSGVRNRIKGKLG